MRLSLAMIVRDEAESIAAVLGDASTFCDELVVLDTGSVDGTAELAKKAGATVHHFEWIDDFAAARNHAFDLCTGEWIVWLDADDRVTPAGQDGFRRMKDTLDASGDLDLVFLPYLYHFREDNPSICTFSFHRERVVRRSAKLRWEGAVHEAITPTVGRYERRDEPWIEHRPSKAKRARVGDRNLRILEKVVIAGDRRPRTLFYFANELKDNARYEEAIAAYEEYLPKSSLPWERYTAQIYIASCAKSLGDEPRMITALFDALVEDSSRAEAFNELGVYHYQRGEWARAIPWLRAALGARRPENASFVVDEHYTWIPWDYVSVCHAQLGELDAAIEASLQALPLDPDRARIIKNLHWIVDQLPSGEGQR